MHENRRKRTLSYEKKPLTLDIQHTQKSKVFEQQRDECATLRERLHDCKLEFNAIAAKKRRDCTEAELVQYVKLQDEIEDIEGRLESANSDEVDYYTNTGAILYKYYETIENNTGDMYPNEKCTILDFFNKARPKETVDSEYCRANLLEKYLSVTDPDYINNNVPQVSIAECPYCESKDRQVHSADGTVFCPGCHSVESVITENDKPNYKNSSRNHELTYWSYQRSHHLIEWLNHIQGKESTNIPEEVFDKILIEVKKQRITNMALLTHKKIKEILKKLKINKYYEHIPYILNRITGLPNPYFGPELEEKLRNMFTQMQVPYLKHSLATRKNFLSYSYTLHKLLQLLGETQFLKHFPLLKSREKLHQHEQIWKKICEEMEWEFIRSI